MSKVSFSELYSTKERSLTKIKWISETFLTIFKLSLKQMNLLVLGNSVIIQLVLCCPQTISKTKNSKHNKLLTKINSSNQQNNINPSPKMFYLKSISKITLKILKSKNTTNTQNTTIQTQKEDSNSKTKTFFNNNNIQSRKKLNPKRK